MTSKDRMNKAELIAELDAKEQELEAQQKELVAKEQQLNAQQKELEKAKADSSINPTDVTQPSKPVTASSSAPGDPAPSPDGKYHFHSRYRQYRVPGAKFFGNRFATDDETVVEKLKRHGAFGSEFWLTFVPGDAKQAA